MYTAKNQAIEENQAKAESSTGKFRRIESSQLAKPGMYWGIFLTSASVLLLELALTRVFAVILWAHLAFMVVGTALFGFGLSGIYLALKRERSEGDLPLHLSTLSFFLSLAIFACYLVVTNVPFRMWKFSEDPSNFIYLAVWYCALVVPFFIAGLIIAKLLSFYKEQSNTLYGVDLLGAASGALLLIPVIPVFGAEGTVVLAAGLSLIAGLAYTPKTHRLRRFLFVGILTALAFLLPKADTVLPIKLHQTKRRFNQAVANNHIYETRWSPLSRVNIGYHSNDVFDIWIDGGTNESAIFRWSGNTETLKPMRWSSIGLSHDLKRGSDPQVMIIGPAGGKEVLFALSHGAAHVDAVEMDPSIVALVGEEKYASFMGNLYQNERVSLYNDEGRSFLRRQPHNRYDIIQSVNNYTPVAMNAGALNLSAAFLMTKEAMHDYLDRLTPNGVLALHRGAALRIAITMLEVLAERGVTNPKDHIVITSGEVPYFEGILLKKSPWTAEEVKRIDSYLEGRPLQEGKKFHWNPLDESDQGIYGKILRTEPADLPSYYSSLGVKLSPATDNQPFLEHFLQFGKVNLGADLPREFRFRNNQKWRGIIPRGDFPYIAILIESALLATLFVGLPLMLFARKSISHPNFRGLLAYFSSLGFGFIVIEICLMKRYVLFLGNPAYSITTVLVALLFGAGLGSIATGKLTASRLAKGDPHRALRLVIVSVVALALLETLVAPWVFKYCLALGFTQRVLVASALLLPLGFVMGMPFPLGLQLINKTTQDESERRCISAWAWGMNGYFTVIGSAATIFIALLAGFKAALITAVATYIIGFLAIRRIEMV